MSTPDLTPADGYVIVQLLSVDDEESSSGSGYQSPGAPADDDDWRESIYATVVALPAKNGPTTKAKVGSVVLVRKSSVRNAIKITEERRLVDSYAVLAVAGR
jgi:hypothetical protein